MKKYMYSGGFFNYLLIEKEVKISELEIPYSYLSWSY